MAENNDDEFELLFEENDADELMDQRLQDITEGKRFSIIAF